MKKKKKTFSIRDLENLSGIKAHTIRIWEKRYNLLSPDRTETNIRTYSLESLQKLLNIALLYNNGYKISKIAKIPASEIPLTVRKMATGNPTDLAINSFKLAMMNFDQGIFDSTYKKLLNESSFRQIFKETFVPLLQELGLLWQTDTISPAHEHFITNLIKQKILLNTEKLQDQQPHRTDKVFVAYLPENEIHEIGLLYLNYEIVLNGYRCIYLGQTIPMENLTDVLNYFKNVHFLTYFTVVPEKDRLDTYFQDFEEMVAGYPHSKLWVLGRQVAHIDITALPHFVTTFSSIEEVVRTL